jgi:hypothetical protein
VVALVAGSSLAAGCGSAPSTPGVANVGTSSAAGSSSSGAGTKGSRGAQFSSCMRAHGVHNFPDPSSSGGLTIGPGMGIDLDSATFKAAEKACRGLLQIKAPSPAEQAKMQAQALRFSACMRSHGVPSFPDPDFSQGGVRLKLDAKSGLDPSSPQFKAAQNACKRLLPGKGGQVTERVHP